MIFLVERELQVTSQKLLFYNHFLNCKYLKIDEYYTLSLFHNYLYFFVERGIERENQIAKMYGFTSLSTENDVGIKGDIEEGTLYPGLGYGENQLRWGFIRKVYGILAAQILLTIVVSAITVLYVPINDLLRGNSGLLLVLIFLPFVRK